MPFQSQKQRGLFYAARNNPEIRKRRGLNLSAIDKMISHDEGGKLPKRVRKSK